MKVAIKVENLGKKYVIRHEHDERYSTLRDTITNRSKKIVTHLGGLFSPSAQTNVSEEEFWAIKNLNFEILQGDRVGIIGRNGAGKSTLLKVLSRITEPSSGRICINGHIASLLEVGTGFHPELTGRENIFLNGAVLGMTRQEIKCKFDEIVAFAEIERFLDTPVKRYSSGMYVRLAFSIAAHLEPEILVVDEVLAVGDAEFQKKSLGKMEDVSKAGRTVLFVSHNIGAIQSLCTKGLMLHNGTLQAQGDIKSVLESYMSRTDRHLPELDLLQIVRKKGFGKNVKIELCNLYNSDMHLADSFKFGESFYVELGCIGYAPLKGLQFVVGIDTILNQRISTTLSYSRKEAFDIDINQHRKGILKITTCLNPGMYTITLSVRNEFAGFDQLVNIRTFAVEETRENYLIGDPYVPNGIVHIPNPQWQIQ